MLKTTKNFSENRNKNEAFSSLVMVDIIITVSADIITTVGADIIRPKGVPKSPIIYPVPKFSKKLLQERDELLHKMKSFDKSHTVLNIGMSAIAPNLYFIPKIEKTHNIKIISTIEKEELLIKKLKEGIYDLIFITNKININKCISKKIFYEQLYFFVSKTHPLAKKETLTFKEMDGESFLMNREVGFWDMLVRENMPNSHFILQDNLDNLRILIDNSTISSFASNLTLNERIVPNRISIPINNKNAIVDFYLTYKKSIDKKIVKLFFNIQ